MEKSCHSSASNSSSSSSNGNNSSRISSSATPNTLRVLNKSSHKISKPSNITKPHQNLHSNNPNHNNHPAQGAAALAAPPPPLPPAAAAAAASSLVSQQQQQQQSQPPVYNINKNDFRDVVQKLTGSPAHHQRLSSPPPVGPPSKPVPSSRLQKIRPPPLAHLSPGPSPPAPPIPLTQGSDLATNAAAGFASGGGSGWMRSSPLSPLPPFPAVSAAAESPISAYMRSLHSGWGLTGVGPAPHQQFLIPSPGSSASPMFTLPPSPVPFGCMLSPRSSAYPMMLSPGLLFPPSPRLPMPSPR